MLIDKTTTFESVNKEIFPPAKFELTKDVALNKNWIDYLCKNFPNSEIVILSGYDIKQQYTAPECLYNELETITLAENFQFALDEYNKTLVFDEGFSVKEAIVASGKINKIVKEIEEARVDGMPLSPLEKYLYAYMLITDHVYKKENENESTQLSRNLIPVLNGDKIVCVGFANLLLTVCQRLDIPCTNETIIIMNKSTKKLGNHATCCLRIIDSKYNIDGIYHADPTFDAKNPFNIFSRYPLIRHALVNYENISKYYETYEIDSKIVSSIENTKIEDLRNLGAIKHVPKILSKLFPEKTGKNSQIEILRKNALSILDQHNLDYKISDAIDKINEQDAIENLINRVSTYFLSTREFLKNTRHDSYISTYMNTVIINLHQYGFSKEEIANLISNQLSEQNLKKTISENNAYLKDSRPDYFNEYVEQETKKALSKTNLFFEILNRFQFNSNQNLNTTEHIETTANSIAESVISEIFNDKKLYPDLWFAGLLLKHGVPLEIIKQSLKEASKNVDIANVYYSIADQEMLQYYKTNEQQIYTNQLYDPKIFNDPYISDYLVLSSKATQISADQFLEAITNIFISQGNNKKTAVKLATNIIKNMFLPNQKSLH